MYEAYFERNEHYRQRNVLPENIAEAALIFASETRSSRSTGNMIDVDGGVKDAYPRQRTMSCSDYRREISWNIVIYGKR